MGYLDWNEQLTVGKFRTRAQQRGRMQIDNYGRIYLEVLHMGSRAETIQKDKQEALPVLLYWFLSFTASSKKIMKNILYFLEGIISHSSLYL